MTVPPGVSLAFNDGPLVDSPTWTRIDNLAGLTIESITIDRGRTDERSKTMPGTVSIKGIDTAGLLDPTNPSSPYNGNLEPLKQAAVTLYNPVTTLWNWLFRGHVNEFIYDLDVSENWMNFEIQLVDMLDLLNDAEVIPDSAGNVLSPGDPEYLYYKESVGDCFYTGQRCDDRIFAVLADATTAFEGVIWPPGLLEIASGNVFVQGRAYSSRSSLLSVIDEAADADGPNATNRFVATDGSFAFRGRFYRYSAEFFLPGDGVRAPGHEILEWNVGDIPAYNSDSTLAVYTGLSFQRGKTNLVNDALVTPVGIAPTAVAAQHVSSPTSIGKYGVRTGGMSLENLTMSRSSTETNTAVQEAKSFGQAIVDNYKNPVNRVSQITFKNSPETDATRKANVYKLLSGIELSDLMVVTSNHPGGGGLSSLAHFVEHIHYDITSLKGDNWMTILICDLSPRAYYNTIPTSWNPPGTGILGASFTSSASGDTVSFTDTSTPGPSGPITAWAWTFGDGGTSTLQNPVHTFATDGHYTVGLTVTGTGGDGTNPTSQGIVLSSSAPMAAFTWT